MVRYCRRYCQFLPRLAGSFDCRRSCLRRPRRELRYISLEKVIVRYIHHVFPSFKIQAHGAFRVLRDSDVEIEEEAEDLVRVFETMLKRRRRGDVIRVKIDVSMPDHLRQMIQDRLHAASQDVVIVDGLLGPRTN